MAQINAHSVLDDTLLGTFEPSSEETISLQMKAARVAAQTWAKLSVEQRLERLAPLCEQLLKHTDNVVDCIQQSTGKVPNEALLGEIYPLLELLAYYRKTAPATLREQPIATSPFSFPGTTAIIRQKPFGVVLILSPWNYPFQLSMAPLLTALIAGNAVILKPSELCLPIGTMILDLLAPLNLPAGLVQLAVGGREVGEALIDAGPDFVFFTGGLSAGRAVMQRAAQHPVPVLLELGGKDAMLVFADAHLQRAIDAALYGAFCNSGQVCVSIERLYVQRACFDKVLEGLCEGSRQLRLGLDADAELGALTSLAQFDIIQAHYEDAIAQGATASRPLQRNGRLVEPVVLWNVHHGMRIMREETFGPLLAVMAFDDEAEAIHLANDSELGLNASIWSQDISKAQRVAEQLEVGNWVINDVIKNIGHPGLPFGGVKRSGFGRYHGAEGLLSFSQSVAGVINRSHLPQEPNWFPYSSQRYQAFKAYFDFLHGEGPFWQRGRRNGPLLQTFRQYSAFNFRQSLYNLKLWLKR